VRRLFFAILFPLRHFSFDRNSALENTQRQAW
jgi:hypothetical protein